MKRRIPVCLVILMLFAFVAAAQEKPVQLYKNSVKLNSVALVLSNASILYERSFNEHWSLQLGAGRRWGGGSPKVLGLGDLIVGAGSSRIKGYSLTPEARYYFNNCDCQGAASGLYAGLYGRWTTYYGDLNFRYWNGSEYIDAAVNGNLRELGVGVQFGYQLIIRQRFLVDIMFAGPRLSSDRVRLSLDLRDVEHLVPVIEEEINERLEWLGMDPISIHPSPELEARFGFRNFRYALGVGILF